MSLHIFVRPVISALFYELGCGSKDQMIPNYLCLFSHIFVFQKVGQPRPLFVYFRSFQMQIFTEKSIGVSRIRTRIVEVEGEHADHLTTTRPLILFVPAHL